MAFPHGGDEPGGRDPGSQPVGPPTSVPGRDDCCTKLGRFLWIGIVLLLLILLVLLFRH